VGDILTGGPSVDAFAASPDDYQTPEAMVGLDRIILPVLNRFWQRARQPRAKVRPR